MNRGVKCFIKLANSLCLRSFSPQATTSRFSYLCPTIYLFSKPIGDHSFSSFHQKSFFSSSSDLASIADALTSKEWSDEIEMMLSSSNITWAPEVFIYILRNLQNDSEKATCFYGWVRKQDGFKRTETVCNIYLQVISGGEPLDHFWAVYEIFRRRGINMNSETYAGILRRFKRKKKTPDAHRITREYNDIVAKSAENTLVMLVATMIKGSEWNSKLENDIAKIQASFSDDDSITLVLRELLKEPFKALRFFQWVNERQNYSHSSITYNVIAWVLGKRESIVEFWDIVSEMGALGYALDFDTYTKILKYFIYSEMMEDAMKLFVHMMNGAYKPRIRNCFFLLRALSDYPNHLNLLFRVAKTFEESGYSLSKEAYDQIHRSLAHAGKFDEAEKIRNTMRNVGCDPDNHTYSHIVFGLCKLKELRAAFEVFGEMGRHECVPSTRTWTKLIQGCFAADDVDSALTYFTKMVGRGCNLDAYLLDVMVKGFIKHGKVSAAHVMMLEVVTMVGRVKPLHATYKALIEKLADEGKVEEALELLQKMIEHKYPPFPDPFDKYFGKFGSVAGASDYLNLITSRGKKSSLPFCRVFKWLFREGRESDAHDLLKRCPPNVQQCGAVHRIFKEFKSVRWM